MTEREAMTKEQVEWWRSRLTTDYATEAHSGPDTRAELDALCDLALAHLSQAGEKDSTLGYEAMCKARDQYFRDLQESKLDWDLPMSAAYARGFGDAWNATPPAPSGKERGEPIPCSRDNPIGQERRVAQRRVNPPEQWPNYYRRVADRRASPKGES